jgi:hypothetical protein
MSLGFRDCCNEFSYFLVLGIPATVSENETYYIQTTQGFNFCATYVNIPPLNYQPPIYNLLEMTEQVDCYDILCTDVCTNDENIILDEFLAGSVSEGVDCEVLTLVPMTAECVVVNPTFDNVPDGVVSVSVRGGRPPYTFLNSNTNSNITVISQDGDVYTLYNNGVDGNYFITVVDSAGDFIIPLVCILDGPPPPPNASCISSRATVFGAPDGAINLTIAGGTPPYTVRYQGQVISLPLSNLAAGDYTLQYSDANYTQSITCTVTQPPIVNYPDVFCFSFTFCGTLFQLSFVEDSTFYNYRAQYVCINPGIIGLTQMRIRWESVLNRWASVQQTAVTGNIQFTGPTGNCVYGNGVVYFLGPTTSTTPIGAYQGSGGMLSSITAVVTLGYCPITVTGQITQNYCQQTNTLGIITLQAQGGTGQGYIYYYSAVGAAGVVERFSPILTNLQPNTYQIFVSDSSGDFSPTIFITISSTPFAFNIMSTSVCGDNMWANTYFTQTGTIATMVNAPGQFRQNTAEITLWIDFSYMPQGVSVTGNMRFKINYYTRGGRNDGNPLQFQVSQFEIPLSLTKLNGNNVNFMNNPTVLYTNQPNIVGPTNYYEPNAGNWSSVGHNDSCLGGATGRLSPNWWGSCSSPADPAASFIESDTSAKQFVNEIIITSGFIEFNRDTKLGLTFRLTQRMNSPAFAPPIRLQTNASTILPSSINVTQQNQLDAQNINPVRYAGTNSQATVQVEVINLAVKEGCATLPASNKFNLLVLNTDNSVGSFVSTKWLDNSVENPPVPNLALSSPWVVCSTVPDWFA